MLSLACAIALARNALPYLLCLTLIPLSELKFHTHLAHPSPTTSLLLSEPLLHSLVHNMVENP